MRGSDQQQAPLFSYLSLEERVPPEHPLRAIRQMVDTALMGLGERCEALYAHTGRPAIAPERYAPVRRR